MVKTIQITYKTELLVWNTWVVQKPIFAYHYLPKFNKKKKQKQKMWLATTATKVKIAVLCFQLWIEHLTALKWRHNKLVKRRRERMGKQY